MTVRTAFDNIEREIATMKRLHHPNLVQLFVDPTGQAGRVYGVERGWLPENNDVNPFLKLFGMLWGLGAWYVFAEMQNFRGLWRIIVFCP